MTAISQHTNFLYTDGAALSSFGERGKYILTSFFFHGGVIFITKLLSISLIDGVSDSHNVTLTPEKRPASTKGVGGEGKGRGESVRGRGERGKGGGSI